VLVLATCDKSPDNYWRYSEQGKFHGLVLGDNKFMACWNSGPTDDPYRRRKNLQPLRKKPFKANPLEAGCTWIKQEI